MAALAQFSCSVIEMVTVGADKHGLLHFFLERFGARPNHVTDLSLFRPMVAVMKMQIAECAVVTSTDFTSASLLDCFDVRAV